MLNPVESLNPLDISNATARVAPDQLKLSAILSDTVIRRAAVDREAILEIRKKDHISLGDQQFYYLQVFQSLY